MMPVSPLKQAVASGLTTACLPLKLRPSFPDQIGSDMQPSLIPEPFAGGLRCEVDGGLGHLALPPPRTPGNLLHRATVPIPRLEVHFCIDSGGIGPQYLLHAAGTFEYLSPVQQGDL